MAANRWQTPLRQVNVTHVHIHSENRAEETTVFQGDIVDGQTNITDSYVHMDAFEDPAPRPVHGDGTNQGVLRSYLHPIPRDEARGQPERSNSATVHGSTTSSEITAQCEALTLGYSSREGIERASGKRNRIAFLRDQAMCMIQEQDYRPAKKHLDEIKNLQNPLEADILLLDAECNIHLGKQEAYASVDRLREVILECEDLSAEDIRKRAEQLVKRDRKVAGILMYRISTDKRKYETADFDNLVLWIQNRMLDTRDPARMMQDEGGESLRIVIDHVVDWRVAIWENLQRVNGANPVTKALYEARCACSITYACPDMAKNLRIGKKGIKVLEDRFQDNPPRYKYYSWLLDNVGCAYQRLGNYNEARRYFTLAVRATKRATDHVGGEKEYGLKKSGRNLKMVSGKVASKAENSVFLSDNVESFE